MKNSHDVEGTGKAAERDVQSNENRVLASGSLQSIWLWLWQIHKEKTKKNKKTPTEVNEKH